MKDYAAQHNIVYVDYYFAMVNENQGMKSTLSDDGVHPNEAGYKVMAPLVEAGIAEALSDR
jgi:lysophospholipase L1-like esterase